jgi:hypothetical protein
MTTVRINVFLLEDGLLFSPLLFQSTELQLTEQQDKLAEGSISAEVYSRSKVNCGSRLLHFIVGGRVNCF